MALLDLCRQNRGGTARRTCRRESAEWAKEIRYTCSGGGGRGSGARVRRLKMTTRHVDACPRGGRAVPDACTLTEEEPWMALTGEPGWARRVDGREDGRQVASRRHRHVACVGHAGCPASYRHHAGEPSVEAVPHAVAAVVDVIRLHGEHRLEEETRGDDDRARVVVQPDEARDDEQGAAASGPDRVPPSPRHARLAEPRRHVVQVRLGHRHHRVVHPPQHRTRRLQHGRRHDDRWS